MKERKRSSNLGKLRQGVDNDQEKLFRGASDLEEREKWSSTNLVMLEHDLPEDVVASIYNFIIF